MKPYYEDEFVTLYHGDCREVLGDVGGSASIVVTDRQPERVTVLADLGCGCRIGTPALSSSPVVNGQADELRCPRHGLQFCFVVRVSHLNGAPYRR